MIDARDLTPSEQISLLSGSDFWRTQGLPDRGIPAVLLSDGPHGLRVQADTGDHLGLSGSLPATCFPPAVTLASSWDRELLAEVGRAVGREARAQGVAVVLGPGMNIKRHPRGGRNFEYLSEDPLLAGELAAAMVTGIQDTGVGACVKHFAVNNQETMRFVADSVVDERTLRELYLAAFERAVVSSAPWTVMAAYNPLNGTYCTDHHELLSGILREEWGFTGLVMSDWGATDDRVAGVHAGMDLEMPGSAGISDGDVAAAVRAGRLDAEAVTRSAQRVLDLVARAPVAAPGPFDARAHDDLARRAAAAGTVLLTNDGTLPLSPDVSIAVIGAFAQTPRYQGSGSSLVNPVHVTTTLQAFADRGLPVTYAPGYDPVVSGPDDALIAEAAAVAAAADVAVVLAGLPGVYESEGFDRPDLALPTQHEELIRAVCAANPRTVVALSNGAPVTTPWLPDTAAVLECYLGGQASGAALVDVLLGDAEPTGRLAETFPAAAADIAADPWFPGHPHQVEYREGLAVGYRHHLTHDVPPLFAFGHGLGYTTFDHDDVRLDRASIGAGDDVTVTVSVRNTGARRGTHVVQVYLSDRTGVVPQPARALAGFTTLTLEPGASGAVAVTVAARSFQFWDVTRSGWATPTGDFELAVGRSSTDLTHRLDLTVAGDAGGTRPGRPAAGAQKLIAATDQEFAARLGYPIPRPRPVRPFTRLSTVGEIQQTRLGRVIKQILQRAGGADAATLADQDPALAKMFERGLAEMPLRSAALFSRGRITWPALDAVVAALNGEAGAATGHAWRAVRSLAGRSLSRGR